MFSTPHSPKIRLNPFTKPAKPVFGGGIEKTIPSFLEQCFKLIEEKGLEVEGIFRISGDNKEMTKWKTKINAGNTTICDQIVYTQKW